MGVHCVPVCMSGGQMTTLSDWFPPLCGFSGSNSGGRLGSKCLCPTEPSLQSSISFSCLGMT